MNKRLLTFFLSILMLCGSTMPVFAKSLNNTEISHEILTENGLKVDNDDSKELKEPDVKEKEMNLEENNEIDNKKQSRANIEKLKAKLQKEIEEKYSKSENKEDKDSSKMNNAKVIGGKNYVLPKDKFNSPEEEKFGRQLLGKEEYFQDDSVEINKDLVLKDIQRDLDIKNKIEKNKEKKTENRAESELQISEEKDIEALSAGEDIQEKKGKENEIHSRASGVEKTQESLNLGLDFEGVEGYEEVRIERRADENRILYFNETFFKAEGLNLTLFCKNENKYNTILKGTLDEIGKEYEKRLDKDYEEDNLKEYYLKVEKSNGEYKIYKLVCINKRYIEGVLTVPKLGQDSIFFNNIEVENPEKVNIRVNIYNKRDPHLLCEQDINGEYIGENKPKLIGYGERILKNGLIYFDLKNMDETSHPISENDYIRIFGTIGNPEDKEFGVFKGFILRGRKRRVSTSPHPVTTLYNGIPYKIILTPSYEPIFKNNISQILSPLTGLNVYNQNSSNNNEILDSTKAVEAETNEEYNGETRSLTITHYKGIVNRDELISAIESIKDDKTINTVEEYAELIASLNNAKDNPLKEKVLLSIEKKDYKNPEGNLFSNPLSNLKIEIKNPKDEELKTSVEIKAKKFLTFQGLKVPLNFDNGSNEYRKFDFVLKNKDGKSISTAQNDEKGNLLFNIELTDKQLGNNRYFIEEVKGDDLKIKYDSHKEEVNVDLDMINGHELRANVSYDENGAVFSNIYEFKTDDKGTSSGPDIPDLEDPTYRVLIRVKYNFYDAKGNQIENREAIKDQILLECIREIKFDNGIVINLNDKTQYKIGWDGGYEFAARGGTNQLFPCAKFDELDEEARVYLEFYYDLDKLREEGVPVEITQGQDYIIYNFQVDIHMRDHNPVPVEIKAKKILLNSDDKVIPLGDKRFEFILRDGQGNEVGRTKNDKDGNTTFSPIMLTAYQRGDNKFFIEEVNNNKNSLTIYDTHKEEVNVNLGVVNGHKLKANVSYDEDGALFTNKLNTSSFQIVRLAFGEDPFVADEVKNDKGIVISHKISDKDRSKTLDGAEYDIYQINSDDTETKISHIKIENGISNLVENLLPGKYKLKEARAPDGYFIASKDFEFEITKEDIGKALVEFIPSEQDKIKIQFPVTGNNQLFLLPILQTSFIIISLILIRKKNNN